MVDAGGSDPGAVPNDVTVSISIGEYLDRLTILELKAERGGSDQAREAAVARLASWKRSFDWAGLDRAAVDWAAVDWAAVDWAEVAPLVDELRRVNGRLWDCEDEIRRHVSRSETAGVAATGAEIVSLNDERASIKAELDLYTGATWPDTKHYAGEPSASTR